MIRTLLASLVLASAAAAGTLKVPQDFSTIQAAVDAAQSGDTVAISPGLYTETVALTGKSQLVVKGAGNVQIDASGLGAGLDVETCDQLTVKGLRFIGADGPAIFLNASTHVTISKCRIEPASGGDSITTQDGSQLLIDKCAFVSTATAGLVIGTTGHPTSHVIVQHCLFSSPVADGMSVVAGDDVNVLKNTFSHPGGSALVVAGAIGVVNATGNHVLFPGDVGIFAQDANGMIVESNLILHGAAGGVHVIGSGGLASVDGNRVIQCAGVGVAVEANGGQIVTNRVIKGGDAGAVGVGNTMLVAFNRILHSADRGLDVSGTQGNIQGNKLVHTGGPALVAAGDGATLSNNRATSPANGYVLSGANLIVAGNRVTHSALNGFELGCDTAPVNGNTSIGAVNDGFKLTGAGNTLTGNVGKKSGGLDLEELPPGSNTIDGTNSFGTTNEP